MKISYRILISALVIVVLVFASSTLTFYSYTGKIVLGLAGLALSLVFLLLFLDRKNAGAKAEYSRFNTLINQDLSLREMADLVLARIIKSTGLSAGRLYIVDNDTPVLISSYGLLNETSLAENKIDLYPGVIERGEETEFCFTENFPVIRSGLAELAIRYLLIYPVIYNSKVIAVLEVASVNSPRKKVKEYLAGIKDQLAAGLSKAYAMRRLENLVRELKVNKEEPVNVIQASQEQTGETIIEEPALFLEEEEIHSEPAEQASEALQREIEKRASHSILCIDSNAENRKIITRYLSSKHYQVLQASGIAEGMNEISLKKPFAVTLSVSPSNAASWDALKKLRESDETRTIPVILYNTVDPLNFGYGLQVYDYVFGSLNAGLINAHAERLSVLSGSKVNNILCAGFTEEAVKTLKEQLNARQVKVTSVNDQNAAFKTASKLQPGLVLVDAFMDKGGGILLVDRLKTAFETRDLPVILCLKSGMDNEELSLLAAGIEEVTIRSKGHRIDILKAIRDRIHLEEGFTGEDTSSILIESKTDTDENIIEEGVKALPSNKVLIVDDDTATLSEVGDIVSKSGCETTFAKSGLECLAKLQKLKPDLILLDIMMPQMDGFETIKRIKAERNLKDIPVFALTSHEMIDEKEILIRNGFDDFVSKPVDSGSLSFKIEKILNPIAEF